MKKRSRTADHTGWASFRTHPARPGAWIASRARNSLRSTGPAVLLRRLRTSRIAAFIRASNIIYDVPEGRPFWKTTPIRLGVTVLITVLLVVSALMVVVSGGVARHVGQVLGIGSTAVTVWNIAKWPVLLIIVILMISILFWVAPNAKRKKGFQLISPGGAIAVVVWLIASGLFAFYVANFSHYNKTYGSIAGVIIMLIWLWISNLAILFGAEFNAELERGRAAAGGQFPMGQEPYVELRDTTKLRKRRQWS